MKKISVTEVIEAVKKLCIEANINLPQDLQHLVNQCKEEESHPLGKMILEQMIENANLAKNNRDPICQDTGMAVFFVTIGQEVYIEGGSLTDAINQGVREGYAAGYLRYSVVKSPLERINTGDNTPAIIHYDIVPGNELKIEFAPKGFGSENMSRIKMLKPSDGIEGIVAFVLETIELAGGNPCPPIVVGVGLGGTMEKAALLSKKALLRPVGKASDKAYLKALEENLLDAINQLGIGPQGLGGDTTALAVHVEEYPTHIAGLPVAVNINCHVARHQTIIL